MYRKLGCLLVLWCLMMTTNIMAQSMDRDAWLQSLKAQAMREGIRADLFDQLLGHWQPKTKVIRLDRSQPEKRITFESYRKTRANAGRIHYGRRAWRKHGTMMTEIGKHYGVDPCVIAAIWGIETSYGHYMGKFPVVASLATLAYDGRRAEFFRKELLLALHIVNDGHVSPYHFVGEWAGGSGHPQFLPSSWLTYAQDYNGDGQKDIWGTLSDVFASIANYLKENGWQANGAPWAVHVIAPEQAMLQQGFKNAQHVQAWRALGVVDIKGRPLPDSPYKVALIQLEGGPLILAYQNFSVIMRYNRSVYYAGTVSYLADRICRRPSIYN